MHDATTRRDYPFLDLLEDHAEALRDEALAVPLSAWSPMHGYQSGCFGYVLEPGRWSGDFPGADFAAHRAACPLAAALISRVPGVELGSFLRMEPGGTMLPHTDPRDDRLVRVHLGLQLPEEERAWWVPGTARLMDTRQTHWARNPGTHSRVTMVLDVRMPFVAPDNAWGPWRPDDPNVRRPPLGSPVR
jgi:beta-hydroxylase